MGILGTANWGPSSPDAIEHWNRIRASLAIKEKDKKPMSKADNAKQRTENQVRMHPFFIDWERSKSYSATERYLYFSEQFKKMDNCPVCQRMLKALDDETQTDAEFESSFFESW